MLTPSTAASAPADIFASRIADARGGSPEALGRVLNDFRAYLLLVANRQISPLLAGHVRPSDIVQETFARAHEGFEGFNGASAEEWRAWLLVILRNQLLNALRDHIAAIRDVRRRVPLEAPGSENGAPQGLADSAPSPLDALVKASRAEALHLALERLSDDHRRVIQLRIFEDLSFKDIGLAMNRSTDAVSQLYGRAVRRLGELLGPSHDFC